MRKFLQIRKNISKETIYFCVQCNCNGPLLDTKTAWATNIEHKGLIQCDYCSNKVCLAHAHRYSVLTIELFKISKKDSPCFCPDCAAAFNLMMKING